MNMKNFKKSISLFAIQILLFFIYIPLHAQTGDGGLPGEFLRYGVGARALGLGRAFTAMANDASAIYWNPAGLIGVQRKEFSTMYSNLYYDSRYTYMAFAMPRTFLGANNAFGFGWVNLTMADFDQRDEHNQHLGDFDMYEQAFIFSGAREFVHPVGILNYGVNLKFVNQAFPGYTGTKFGLWNNMGLDVGITFVPINIPIVPLRYIMPLRIGINIQNLLAPKIGVENSKKDEYPCIFRIGAYYRLVFSNMKLNLLYDYERVGVFSQQRIGHYGGFELMRRYKNFWPSLRLGRNNRSENFTIGAGLKFDFIANAVIRLDYVHAFNKYGKYYNDDGRFFLTVEFGQKYDADYFFSKDKNDKKNNQIRTDYLHAIAQFPNEQDSLSAIELATKYDQPNKKRYYKFIGGLGWANVLFEEAKENLRQGNIGSSKGKAKEANLEYKDVYLKSEKRETVLKYDDQLNYCESLIIADSISRAISVLNDLRQASLRSFYLGGICYNKLEMWDEAISAFEKGIQDHAAENQDMLCLSLLGLGKALAETGQYDAALQTLNKIILNRLSNLTESYPPYPAFEDKNIVDDAQFYLAYTKFKKFNITLTKKQRLDIIAEMVKIRRFYPDTQLSQFIDSTFNNLFRFVNENDPSALTNVFDSYKKLEQENYISLKKLKKEYEKHK